MSALRTSAIVLAGGRSSRLGEDKRRLRLWGDDGPMLLERTVEMLKTLSDDVIVVLNDPAEWRGLSARIVSDRWPNGGAVGGIASGLRAMRYDFGLVVAADMPLLDPKLLTWLIERPRTYDALIPLSADELKNGGWQTLCALYRRTCLGGIEPSLDAGIFQIRRALDFMRVETIPVADWQAIEPTGHSFLNINTPDDLETARRAIAENGPPAYNGGRSSS